MHPLVVIPVFNEENTIESLINELLALGFKDILIIDDASEDSSIEIAKKLKVETISLPFNMGTWSAIRVGFKYALDKDYDQVITIDADGQHIPNDIPKLLNGLRKGFDIVIGACPQRANMAKKVCWWLFRKFSGLKINDFTSGFRAYSKSAFSKFSTYNGANLEYQDVGVLIMAKKFGLKIVEVPVEMKSRTWGKSKVFPSLKSILRYFLITFTIIMVKGR
ncbi:MAG TPA: glycosyltransferase family 2 protein [Candidatus Desulfofervidus auxilii]|uniref:Glycosyltransferase family 2 protein n=1 Tax=Desulfofervidus auxilii TaxID=1621989 RepID=A0A7C1VZ09_DESA2|nr:glycosyltransferase family 2 protein [Candidatus Desulfofervidus auxilii]